MHTAHLPQLPPTASPVARAATSHKYSGREISTIARAKGDRVELGKAGVSPAKAQSILLERAYNQLRGIVGDAKDALGIPEGLEIDTSPEATANRIADFALGFFDKFLQNSPELANDEAGRGVFADFIGAAIGQGIQEARDILGALSALSPNIQNNIDSTASIIQDRLDQFVLNGI